MDRLHAWFGDYYILDDEFAFSYGEGWYVDRSDQITNNEERLNGENDIMLVLLVCLQRFNCISDNREWNGSRI